MNTITPSAPTLHTVASASAAAKPAVPAAPSAPAEAPAKKTDPVAEIQANKEVLAQRMNQSLDKSQLNYSFDKQSSTLSVKVVNKQSGQFIRQIDYKGFQAMAFISHGYKGRMVDSSA